MTTGNGTGTFETLAVQAATLLGPVSRRLADGKILPLLTELGMPFAGQLAQTAGLAAAVDACVAAGDQIEDAAERIVQASDGDDLAALSAAALDLVKGVTALIGAVEALSTALSTAAATIANLPPGVLTSFLSELPRRMVDYAVVTTLENNLDVLAGFLELFGVIDRTDENIGSTDPAKPEFTLVRLQLGNLPKLLTSPLGLARDLYGWGTPTFDGTAFFDRVATVLSRVGFPAFFDRMATPPTLELVVAEASVAPTKPEPGISLRLRTGIDETFDGDPDAGLSWSATVRVTAPEGSELIIRPDGQMQLSGPGQASTEGEVRLQAQFEPVDPADAVLVFGQQGGTRLQVQKAHFDFGVTFVWDAGSGAAHGEAGFLLGIRQRRADPDAAKGRRISWTGAPLRQRRRRHRVLARDWVAALRVRFQRKRFARTRPSGTSHDRSGEGGERRSLDRSGWAATGRHGGRELEFSARSHNGDDRPRRRPAERLVPGKRWQPGTGRSRSRFQAAERPGTGDRRRCGRWGRVPFLRSRQGAVRRRARGRTRRDHSGEGRRHSRHGPAGRHAGILAAPHRRLRSAPDPARLRVHAQWRRRPVRRQSHDVGGCAPRRIARAHAELGPLPPRSDRQRAADHQQHPQLLPAREWPLRLRPDAGTGLGHARR